MNVMSAPPVQPADLLDLKLLPAWVKEPRATNHYDHYAGEDAHANSAAATGVSGPRIDHFAPRTVEDGTQRPGPKPDGRHRDRAPKKEGATDVAIPVQSRIAVRRTELRRLRQSHSKARFVFFRVRACSKM